MTMEEVIDEWTRCGGAHALSRRHWQDAISPMALCMLASWAIVGAMAVGTCSARAADCSWSAPGADPYTGDVPAAVESYTDIPPAARSALRERMERRRYDDVAVIGRDTIAGDRRYGALRDMHWGAGRLCRGGVDRSAWAAGQREIGLVYCEAGHCLIVPTVCRNVARIDQLPVAGGAGPTAGGEDPSSETGLEFDHPAATGQHQGQDAMIGGVPATVPAASASVVAAAGAWFGSGSFVGWSGGGMVPASVPTSPPTDVVTPRPHVPVPVVPVPEPSTWALLGAGIAALAWMVRR